MLLDQPGGNEPIELLIGRDTRSDLCATVKHEAPMPNERVLTSFDHTRAILTHHIGGEADHHHPRRVLGRIRDNELEMPISRSLM